MFDNIFPVRCVEKLDATISTFSALVQPRLVSTWVSIVIIVMIVTLWSDSHSTKTIKTRKRLNVWSLTKNSSPGHLNMLGHGLWRILRFCACFAKCLWRVLVWAHNMNSNNSVGAAADKPLGPSPWCHHHHNGSPASLSGVGTTAYPLAKAVLGTEEYFVLIRHLFCSPDICHDGW